ncbi:hypothetical protein RQM47_13600 [Rubrivirga sp. S365]|uniref:Uncharacterized protein n=1 Tax=Rubrivirga litoralis TaxID=3075598 RepID=A0ABU3BN08_9BACT|nr:MULTISPECIES: hypothetical protein [unclassified Rubrivirga]MDT0630605.1 hypothetical protein [Rubrivirga sp. F394]MDT7857682.1 hypothetical protein [Rubrivirga sp. S365]
MDTHGTHPPAGGAPGAGRSSFDLPLFVAALGSLLLAVPGAVGFAFIVSVLWDSSWQANDEAVASAAAIALPLVGFYLLVGYWRSGFVGARPPRPAWFWWLSAAYNGLGLAIVVAETWGPNAGVPLLYVALAVAWTGFMVALGVSRATGLGRRARS